MSTDTCVSMTEEQIRDTAKSVFGNTSNSSSPPSGCVPETPGYETVTNKVVEVRTPTSSTRFHAPNDKVEFDREKYDAARKERQVQGIRVHLPNSRYR